MADNLNKLDGEISLNTTGFKAGITAITQQAKLAESSFKAMASGMENWATTEEGLEARLKMLNTVADTHRRKIENLKVQYEKIVTVCGENSTAAQDMLMWINKETAAFNKSQLEISKNQAALEKMRDTSISLDDKLGALDKEIKILKSDFTAATSSMGEWESTQQGLALKSENLNKILILQRSKVSELKTAYSEVAAAQGKNSDAAQEMKIKLNDETTALNKIQSEIINSDYALDKLSDTTVSANDRLTSLDKKLAVVQSGFNATTSGMKDYTSTTAGLKQKITELTQTADIHKQKLAILKSEYANVSEEQGKSSNAARDLKIQINDETSALNKNKTELSINKNMLVNFGQELNGAATKAEVATAKLNNFTKKLSDVGSKTASVGTAMLPVTAAIAAGGVAAVKMGSDYAENINKVETAFDSSAESVKKWSETTLDKIGIANVTALDMAAQFGDMATSMGKSTDEAAEMSTKLADLAGNLASYKNISLDVAKTGLNGIFTGETESLKQLGVVMTETNLKSFAMSEGIHKDYDEMSEAEKVTLRYNYVLEKTKNSQGDFAKTSSGTANSFRTMQESAKELGVSFSEELLPSITPIIQGATRLIKSFTELDSGQKKVITTVALVTAGVAPLLIVAGKTATAISTITTATTVAKTVALAKTAVTALDTIATSANTGATVANTVASGANATAAGVEAVAKGAATTATVAETAAQTALNVAMDANPIGLVVGAIALLATGITALIGVMQPEKENLDAITDSVNKQSESWKNLKQSSSENITLSQEQGQKASDLANKLDGLVGANGRVKGSKDEVKKVMAELNAIYPNSVYWIDKETVGYDKTNGSLKNLIETKRAQAVLDAAEPAYKEALANTTKVQNEQAEIALKITEKELEQKEKQSVWNLKSQSEAKELGKEIEELHKDYAKGGETLKGYYDIVNKSEDLSGAIATSNHTKIKEYTNGTIDMFSTSATTSAEYSDKIKSLALTYLDLKQKFDKGQDGVTQSMVDNAKNNLDSNYKSWQKVGAYSADGYLIGFKDSNAKNLADIEKEMQKVIDKANQKLKIKSPSRVFMQMGDYSGQGFNLGFTSSMKTALKNAESTINAGINGLNAQTVNSPTLSGNPSSSSYSTSQSPTTTTRTVKTINYITLKADDLEDAAHLARILNDFEQVKNAGEAM